MPCGCVTEDKYPLLPAAPLLASPGKHQMPCQFYNFQLPFWSTNTQRSSGRSANIHLSFRLDSLCNVELFPGMVSGGLLFSSACPLSLLVIHTLLLANSTLSHYATLLKTSCLYVALDLFGLSSEMLTMSLPPDYL